MYSYIYLVVFLFLSQTMVFFSTCDSVDFHALLLRNAEWPQGLDAVQNPTQDTEQAGQGIVGNQVEVISVGGHMGAGKGTKGTKRPSETTMTNAVEEETNDRGGAKNKEKLSSALPGRQGQGPSGGMNSAQGSTNALEPLPSVSTYGVSSNSFVK